MGHDGIDLVDGQACPAAVCQPLWEQRIKHSAESIADTAGLCAARTAPALRQAQVLLCASACHGHMNGA